MGALFNLPNKDSSKNTEEKSGSKVKLKKGDSFESLIITARKLVEEKLGKYKETSKCILKDNLNDLIKFFKNTADDGIMAIDTETTGLNTFTDKLVGISVCNRKECLYIPINHTSMITGRLKSQIEPDTLKELFGKVFAERKFKWVYHNAKFDLAVLRTFFGYAIPDPHWDTMLAANLLEQDEEHNLKYLYNKYIAEEDEGVNRFDTLFKGITFDYVPLDVATIYAGKDAYMTLELYDYQDEILSRPEYSGVRYVMENIEVPLLPILEDMQRTGVNINMTMCNEFMDKYMTRLKEAESKVYSEIDKYTNEIDEFRIKNYKKKLDNPIKISSPAQLSILFYDILKYKTKSGKGTGVAELEEIGSPLTKALLEYRKMEKLIDAFLIALKLVGDYDSNIIFKK